MFRIFIISLCLLLCHTAKAQEKQDSVYLQQLLDGKRIDTVSFMATYWGIGKNPYREQIITLAAQRLLHREAYRSAISFTPVLLQQKMFMPIKDTGTLVQQLAKTAIPGQQMKVTVIVFHCYDQTLQGPFFIIDHIKLLANNSDQ